MLKSRLLVCAFALGLIVLVGCGTNIPGVGFVTVAGLAPGQVLGCGQATGEVILVQGSGFLSEHGVDVTVLFAAVTGTPFQGGTSDMEEVPGTVLSDTLCEVQFPNAVGDIHATISVILPGLNLGTSPPVMFTIGAGLSISGPFANPDFYESVGNVTLSVDAAGGVLPNDDPIGCYDREVDREESPASGGSTNSTLGFVTAFDATSALGGLVSMNADGSFSYIPPLGVGGTIASPVTDTFLYTMNEPGGDPSTTVVFIDLVDVVWFIDDDPSTPPGDGRQAFPMDGLPAFNIVQQLPTGPNDDQPQGGDWIFVYSNTQPAPYDDGIILGQDQKLIGQGVDLVVPISTGPLNIEPAVTDPVLTNSGISIGEISGQPVIILGDRNQVRGLNVDEPLGGGFIGEGIVGVNVAGPTSIDQVNIANTGFSGIRLSGCTGTFDIGDPNGIAVPCNTIVDSGIHGIEIGGGQRSITANVQAASPPGPTVNVYGTDITGASSAGIWAFDCNLSVDLCNIDDCFNGILYANGQFATLCTLGVVNSNIGITQQIGFRGITIDPFGGDIRASILTTDIIATEEAIYAGTFATSGGGLLEISVDSCVCESTITGFLPTVYIFGSFLSFPLATTVTSMRNNTIIGNGQGGGWRCDYVLFDADTVTMGIQQVEGGDMDCGQSAAARVEGTSLVLLGSEGDLLIDSLDIFQVDGDSAGFVNTGLLTLTITTLNVNHVP